MRVNVLPSTGSQWVEITLLDDDQRFIQWVQNGVATEEFLLTLHLFFPYEIPGLLNEKDAIARRRARVDWAAMSRTNDETKEDMYVPVALAFARDRAQARRTMRRGGFWSLLGGDTELLEELVRLSAFSSLTLRIDALDALCATFGFDRARSSARLIRTCQDISFQFYAEGKDGRPLSLA